MINSRIYDELIGEKGLINNMFSQTLTMSFFPKNLQSLVAQSKNLKYLGCLSDKITAGATSFLKEERIGSSFGEFTERFLGARPDFERLVMASFNELTKKGLNCLNPQKIKLYAQWQYEQDDFFLNKFDENSITYWIDGYNYFTKEKIFIPDFLVYWINIPNPNKKTYYLPTSSGLGAGVNIDSAIKSATLELIERHAFCHFWYLQNKLDFIMYDTKIILEAFPNDREINLLFNNPNVEFKIFDLGDLAPTECVIVFAFFKFKGKDLYSVGASARFSKRDALLKAAYEAYQIMSFATESVKQKPQTDLPDLNTILKKLTNFESQFNFYNLYPEFRSKSPIFERAMGNLTEKKIKKFKNKIKSVLEIDKIITDENFFCVDLSDQNATGLKTKVIRTIIPDLAVISGNFNFPCFGNQIFTDRDNLFTEYPHCFP